MSSLTSGSQFSLMARLRVTMMMVMLMTAMMIVILMELMIVDGDDDNWMPRI